MGIVMLDNKILMSGNQMALYVPPIVPKGSIVNLDLDGNGSKQYRVLKCKDNVAKVMAMYNTLKSAYKSTSTTTTFGSTTAQKYESSTLDNYLNTTWYGTLKDTVKAAIVPENVVQHCYKYYDKPSTPNTPTYTYQYQSSQSDNSYANLNDEGNVAVGNRNVFVLDIKDIFDYFEKICITTNELNILFFNQTTPPTSSYALWLRSSISPRSEEAHLMRGTGFGNDRVGHSRIIRPTLNLDLSKINFTLTAETETWVIRDDAPVNAASRELAAQPCSFTSNGQSFSSISVTDPAATATYVLSYGGLDVAGMDTGSASAFDWDDDAYKTLVFNTPPTGDLLTWLQSNAIKQ